jgi:hypothetical protein
MSTYLKIFNEGWRGWHDAGYQQSEVMRYVIMESKALCYNDLLKEVVEVKKKELAERGGTPFYEPSTYYYKYKEGYHHANVEAAAGRSASAIFSTFHRYRGHRTLGPREIPEERNEYELKLWRISHPNPLSPLETDLWKLTNRTAATEVWAWPMMIGLNEGYYTPEHIEKVLPMVNSIREGFIALGHTEEEFYETQKALWLMLRWDTAKGM